jgi:hypothetical protein
VEGPPHPDLLPASGEKETALRGDRCEAGVRFTNNPVSRRPQQPQRAAVDDQERAADHQGADDLARRERLAQDEMAEQDAVTGIKSVTSITLVAPERTRIWKKTT